MNMNAEIAGEHSDEKPG